MDRQWRLLVLPQHDLKAPVGEGRPDLVVQHPRQAPAGERRIDRGLVGVALQGGVERHALVVAKPPFRRRPGAGRDRDAVLLEVGGGLRGAVAGEVAGSAADDPAHRADPERGEAGIGEVADADRDVDALLDEVHRPVDEQRAGGHRRVGVEVVGEDRQDVEPPEQHRGGDRERAGHHAGVARRRGLGLGDLDEDAPALLDVAAPGLGEPHRAGGAGEQPGADRRLERRHRPRHHRRARVEVPRRLGEAHRLRDRRDDAHGLPAIHDPSRSNRERRPITLQHSTRQKPLAPSPAPSPHDLIPR